MPELPDVECFKRVADRCCRRTVDHVSVTDPGILKGVSSHDLEQRLAGKQLRSARRHGKHLFIDLGGSTTLALHFGMNGSLKLVGEGTADPPYARFKLYFEGDGRLDYINPRRLGGVSLTRDAATFIAQGGLGPDVLDDEFSDQVFAAILASSKRDIKSTLMDQTLMAGIGNIYSDEVLFQARIFPGAGARLLKDEKVGQLFRAMRKTLTAAIESGAGSEEGRERLPKWFLSTQRRPGGLCPRCGAPLATVKRGGRSSYYCPHCQPN